MTKAMKKLFLMAAVACLALFVSCEKGVDHTGDSTGGLYGIWALKTKTEITHKTEGDVTKEVDYSGVHFYLTLSEFPFPHALGKKGSLTSLDLDDVDVDAVQFTYNETQKKISFRKAIWLSEGLTYHMILSGTFDVVELTDKTLVLRYDDDLAKVSTIYAYERMKKQ